MWKTSLISPKKINGPSQSTHSKTGEAVVSGSTAFSGNFKLRISHFPLSLGHLSPFIDTAHSTSPESFAGMLW